MSRGQKDANQAEIVAELTAAHLDVLDLSSVPRNLPELAGIPDLLVGGYHQKWGIRINVLAEIKIEGGKIRLVQSDFSNWWRGVVIYAWTADDILRAFGYDV